MSISKTQLLFFVIGFNITLVYLYLRTNYTILVKENFVNKGCDKYI